MTIPVGTRLEHYEVLGPLGAGGMGEVYRAHDSKLKRDVALKILPAQFVRDPSRLVRFEREAQVLAQLNHPNIAAIYGFEHDATANLPEYADGARFLVLELVEGPTLAERLNAGRLEVSEALRIAAQIAEAMEAAHDKGVLHRDLKPANVKFTSDGKVKVLDFGLAKAMGTPEIPSSSATGAETMTMQETRAGVVMGTASYMSPEQASGKPTDKRTDIFSFGAILYEMLSGRRAFDGKTTSHIIVHVLEQTPDWSALPPLPPGVQELIEGCMEKDAGQRRRDIGDVRIQLQSAITKPVQIQQPRAASASKGRWLWPGVAAAVAILAAAGIYAYVNRPKPLPEAIRFDIGIPESASSAGGAATVSPNGREVAFVGLNKDGQSMLWIRALDAADSLPMAGTEGAAGLPFWSPDGRYLAFEADGKLKKIEASGGPAQTLCNITAGTLLGGFWTADGRILFGGNAPTRDHEVAAAGGAARPLRFLGADPRLMASPVLLPDGKHFLYYAQSNADEGTGIFMAPLDENSPEKPRRLLGDLSLPVYAAGEDSNHGYLLFVRGATGPTSAGTLMAQPFDPGRNELAGDAVPLAENVTPGGFSASQTGVLLFSSNNALGAGNEFGTTGVLAWVDRAGREMSTAGPIRPYVFTIALSPDGARVATSHENDLWIWEFARGVDTRFTFENESEFGPQWRRDGSAIVYTRGIDLYEKPANGAGSPTLFFKSPDGNPLLVGEWTPDGRYVSVSTGGNAGDAWLLPADGAPETRKLMPLVKGPYNERGVRFSSDGRYFSYTSNETGRDEAFVRPFDAKNGTSPGGQWMISKGGGVSPHWRNDGKEMYYMSLDGTMMATPIDGKSGFQPGTPEKLFKMPGQVRFWDVSPDGKKFLLPVAPGMGASTPYHVIVNWTSTLKK